MTNHFEAIIVGAGPAGCSCGYTLAKAGLKTLIVERGKFPGAKNMWGGAYYGPSLNQLFPRFWEEAPVERQLHRHKFSVLTADSSLSTEFETKTFGEPPYHGFSLLRSKFDRWLASKAEEAGAIVASELQADDLLWDRNRVSGIRAGGDELPADIVVACDGVNSLLAEKAGLRKKLSPRDLKLGVKEVIQFPHETIEQRFGLTEELGLAWEFIGTFTRGLPGGAFLYTNKDSLSLGVVVQLSALAENRVKADDLFEEFKHHPALERYLDGGQLVEYSSHLIPTAGRTMMPRLYSDGLLVAGDAAAFCLVTGLILDGANLALASGVAAAETIIQAKNKGDFSQKTLSVYEENLKKKAIMEDLNTFKSAPHFLENLRLYRQYPELVCDLAKNVLAGGGQPRKKIWTLFRQSLKGKISLGQIIRDLIQMKRSL